MEFKRTAPLPQWLRFSGSFLEEQLLINIAVALLPSSGQWAHYSLVWTTRSVSTLSENKIIYSRKHQARITTYNNPRLRFQVMLGANNIK